MRTLRWLCTLVIALVAGILLGLPSGVDRGRIATRSEIIPGQGFPVVAFSDLDYHTDNGVVTTFSSWGHEEMATRAKNRYPAPQITPEVQRSLFSALVTAASRHGELPAVVSGAGLNAITLANRDESTAFRRGGGLGKPAPNTAIIYAERAQYFGQDVWCFLCLTTADRQHGAARVLVMSCVPAYGLVHLQRLDSF